jgi:hypothetical protein
MIELAAFCIIVFKYIKILSKSDQMSQKSTIKKTHKPTSIYKLPTYLIITDAHLDAGKILFLNLGNNGTVPFMGNCGGFPNLVNARIIFTGI